MKQNKIFILLITLLFIRNSFSQDYSYSIKDIAKVEIVSRVNIILKTHKSPTFLISDYENKRIRKPDSNLKPVFGKDNTGFNVFVEKQNSTLKVECFQPIKSRALVIYLPETMKISVENLVNKNITIYDFTNEIVAKADNGDIRMINVSGPIIVQHDRGNTFIEFSKVSQNSPSSIINSRGDIDITLPSDTRADIEVSVPHGELFTDFELEPIKRSSSRYIKSKLNDGGVNIIIIATRANIYLRKQ